MKHFIILLLLFMLLMTSSCRSFEKDVAEVVAAGLSEVIGEAICETIGDMMINALSIGAYYVEYEEWPSNQNELCTFCKNEGFENSFQYWSSCNNMEFSVQEDESFKVSFTRTTTNSEGKSIESPGSMTLSKPDYGEQDIDQLKIELLEVSENSSIQIKSRAN